MRFFDYDYIGAPWPNNFVNRVGNGGFSLRSKKFLELTAKIPYNKIGHKEFDAEDFSFFAMSPLRVFKKNKWCR